MINLKNKAIIIIPARYGSTRFPGKPLIDLAGKTLLQRVSEIAQKAAAIATDTDVLIATDDNRILEHAKQLAINAVMTPTECATGTDRAYHAMQQLPENQQADIIINLQGDAPMTSPDTIAELIQSLRQEPTLNAATPATQLTWEQLDDLKKSKAITPFSGTTVVINSNNKAFWFSKNILPAIRKEDRSQPLSPIYKHIGLYGYRWAFLKIFITLPEGYYEKLEGLEQLRILENGYQLHVIKTKGSGDEIGIDTPEDAKRMINLLQK